MKRVGLLAVLGTAALLMWCVAARDLGGPRAQHEEASGAEAPPAEPAAPEPTTPPPVQAPAPELAQAPNEPPAAPPSEPERDPVLDPGKPSEATVPFPTAQGPVDVLKSAYDRDTRDSAAHELEVAVEAAFKQPTVDRALFKSVACRKQSCKIEIRWSAPRAEGYMLAMMSMVKLFDVELAVAPIGEPSPGGELALEVYWRRKP